jgi:hypothetical protein
MSLNYSRSGSGYTATVGPSHALQLRVSFKVK